MTNQTIIASEAGKKAYAKPEFSVYDVAPGAIMATSSEQYETDSTDDWYK